MRRLIHRLRRWWDRQVNWEYYATLDFFERTVPPEQRYYLKEND